MRAIIGSLQKSVDYLDSHPKIGFFFWFLFSIIVLFLFNPFNQPIMFDRAYLLYMSQAVFRGDPLYQSTPFGYTPLSTIVVGLLMRLGHYFSLNTIDTARITGILFYGLSGGSIFMLGRSVFKDKVSPNLGAFLFCGITFIPLVASVNAEPQVWVLLFSILGIICFTKERWLLCGLCLTIGAMSWHVSVISLIATGVVLLFRQGRKHQLAFFQLSMGVVLGVLPVLLYLLLTDGWVAFWEQAILRKLAVEGQSVGENPFRWMLRGSYPMLSDALHLLLGFIGFALIFYWWVFKRSEGRQLFRRSSILVYLVVYSLFWATFNSLEYQGATDFMPLVPIVIIGGTLVIQRILNLQPMYAILIGCLLTVYNLFDAFIYDLPFTFQDQISVISKIEKEYSDPFVIGFEAYYTVLEKPMPTKFMRYWHYEEFLIDKHEGGCDGILDQIRKKGYDYIIEFDRNYRERSRWSRYIMKKFGVNWNAQPGRSVCADLLISNLTNQEELDNFTIITQNLPIGNYFYTTEYFSVFKIEKDR